jgi:hypothetical protein
MLISCIFLAFNQLQNVLTFFLKDTLLRRTNVKILGRGLCHEIYPEFTKRMLCAGRQRTGGRDACQVSSATSTIFQAIANSFFRR